MKKIILIMLIAMLGVTFIGCDEDDDDYIVIDELADPQAPQGVYSITADEEIYLYWLPVEYDNLRFYRIWRNTDGGNEYYLYDTTLSTSYVDEGVSNGNTYYYAVTTYGWDREESGLSYEFVWDTPRPEGSGLALYDANTDPNFAGFDFSAQAIRPFDYALTDIYIDYDAGLETFFLNIGRDTTDIQDMGFTYSFDEITMAPDTAVGWSYVGWLEIIEGHTYVIWTHEDTYAKLRVTYADYANGYVEFQWAHQEDMGNPQLRPRASGSDTFLKQRPSVNMTADFGQHK